MPYGLHGLTGRPLSDHNFTSQSSVVGDLIGAAFVAAGLTITAGALTVLAAKISPFIAAHPGITKSVLKVVIKTILHGGNPIEPLIEIGIDEATSQNVVDIIKDFIA